MAMRNLNNKNSEIKQFVRLSTLTVYDGVDTFMQLISGNDFSFKSIFCHCYC